MTPSEIVQQARVWSGARVTEIDDAQMFLYLNQVYRKLWQEVAQIDRNYKLKEWKTNLVQDVSVYELAPVDQITPDTGQIKIDSVYAKYNDGSVYKTQLAERDWDDLDYDPEWYKKNQSITSPFYILSDGGIHIFPSPTDSVGDGLIMYANQRPYDLTDAMIEDDILLEREYHDVISYGMLPKVYRQRHDMEMVGVSRQEYEEEKTECLNNLKQRTIRPIVATRPNLDKYVSRWRTPNQ